MTKDAIVGGEDRSMTELQEASLRCESCGEAAVWRYEPSDGQRAYCDRCVPRGCSCQRSFNPDTNTFDGPEETDADGRALPCVEYHFYPQGAPAYPAPLAEQAGEQG